MIPDTAARPRSIPPTLAARPGFRARACADWCFSIGGTWSGTGLLRRKLFPRASPAGASASELHREPAWRFESTTRSFSTRMIPVQSIPTRLIQPGSTPAFRMFSEGGEIPQGTGSGRFAPATIIRAKRSRQGSSATIAWKFKRDDAGDGHNGLDRGAEGSAAVFQLSGGSAAHARSGRNSKDSDPIDHRDGGRGCD